MAIAPHEQIRNRREREFQARVLAAVEKPKRGRIWEFLNSPFVLWTLSALILSFGGSYLTTHRQCIADAERPSPICERLVTEIERRQLQIIFSIKQATTIEQLKKSIEELRGRYIDLRATPLFDLLEQRQRMARRIDFSPVEKQIADRETKLNTLMGEFEQAGVPVSSYAPVLDGESADGLMDEDLPILKIYGKAMELYLQGPTFRMWRVTLPRCRTNDIISTLLTGKSSKVLIVDDNIYDTFVPDREPEVAPDPPPATKPQN